VWWQVLISLVCIGVGVFAGMRLQLARQRWRELRRTLDRSANGKALEGALIVTLRQREAAESAGLVHHVRIINAVQFVLIWNWDLALLLHSLGNDPETWSLDAGFRKKLAARTLALTIFESITKLERLFDPASDRQWSVWRAIRALQVEHETSPHLHRVHALLSPLLSENRVLLEGVRNNISGHRDQNVATQLEWMRRADAQTIEALGWRLLEATSEVLAELSSIVAVLKRHTPQSVLA
jgi:hypothetical protein